MQGARKAVGRFPVLKMKLGKVGVFPNLSAPRVIWVGIEEGEDKLETLAAELEEKLEQEGFSRSGGKWRPHLTLARVKVLKDRERLKALIGQYCEEANEVEVEIKSLSVVKSKLTSQGPIHTVLERISFKEFSSK